MHLMLLSLCSSSGVTLGAFGRVLCFYTEELRSELSCQMKNNIQ